MPGNGRKRNGGNKRRRNLLNAYESNKNFETTSAFVSTSVGEGKASMLVPMVPRSQWEQLVVLPALIRHMPILLSAARLCMRARALEAMSMDTNVSAAMPAELTL
jgi:hypothetical protein